MGTYKYVLNAFLGEFQEHVACKILRLKSRLNILLQVLCITERSLNVRICCGNLSQCSSYLFLFWSNCPFKYNAIAFRNEIEIKIKKVKNLKQKKNWESFCRNRKQQTKVGF